MNDTTFGQLIKENRQKLGISNRKLADKLGLSSGYVFQIEKGNYQPPSEAVLKKMAEIFNMHSDTLILKAGKVPSDIIAGLLEFPDAIEHNRKYFKGERARKAANDPIDIKGQQEKTCKSSEGVIPLAINNDRIIPMTAPEMRSPSSFSPPSESNKNKALDFGNRPL